MSDERKDPRYLEACRMFDMWDWGWGLPSDPHALENMRHAAGLMACGKDDDRQFLSLVLNQYLGIKYRDTIRGEIERIVRSAVRAGQLCLLRAVARRQARYGSGRSGSTTPSPQRRA